MKFADLMARLGEMKSRGPVHVEFINDVSVLESYPEKGMRGTIIDIVENETDVLRMVVDYSDFDEYNKAFESHDYFNDAGKPCLTAREAGYYHVEETIYVMAGDNISNYIAIIGDERTNLYTRYLETGTEQPYVQWLEELVLTHALP